MNTEFKIKVGGKTKDILRITELLAEQGVNLVTVSAEKIGEDVIVRLLTSDDERCINALMKADLEYEARQVLIAEMQDRPGQWASIARKLSEAGVEIEASYLLSRNDDKMMFVFAVSDPKLGEEIIQQHK